MRMLKQVATDCQIHHNRNVRVGDIDGSATCDYDECAYVCYDPPPTYIDYSSYDVLYTGNIIETASKEIINIFRANFNLTFNKLYTLVKYRKKFVDMAVEKLIKNKTQIIDRYGYTSYLREDRGSLFLRRDFPLETHETKGGHSLSVYTETLIGIEEISLNKYISELQVVEQEGLIIKLQKLSPESEEFNKIIDDLNLENKVELLENSIYRMFVDKIQSPATRSIVIKYRTSVFQVPEPTESIRISADALANRGKGRGRKPKPGSKFKLTKKQQKEMELSLTQVGKETVYIHDLFTQSFDRTSFSVSAKFATSDGKIRLLKPSEGVGWRDANPYELPVYNTIVQKQKDGITAKFEKFDIYGLILNPDRKLRIRDKTTEGKTSAVDKRGKNRGKICSIWSKPSLVEVLWKLKIMPFKTQVTETRDQLIGNLERNGIQTEGRIVSEFSDEKLKFFFIWYRTGMNREQICDVLQKEMHKTGRLLVM